MRMLQVFFIFLLIPSLGFSKNLKIDTFREAKNILEEIIYSSDEERITLYCQAKFDENKNVILPDGFIANKYLNRIGKIEWEHVVPVENFGRTFPEWRDGHPLCVDKRGNPFKGRRCAELVNEEFRIMASDLHNLYPAIGAVNASRSNYNFAMLPHAKSDFGTCEMKIDNRKVEPPEHARGKIARAYLYMENTYPRYKMSKQQRQLMKVWDRMYPVTEWEQVRNVKISRIHRYILK